MKEKSVRPHFSARSGSSDGRESSERAERFLEKERVLEGKRAQEESFTRGETILCVLVPGLSSANDGRAGNCFTGANQEDDALSFSIIFGALSSRAWRVRVREIAFCICCGVGRKSPDA